MAPRSPLIRLAIFGKPVAHSLSPRIHGLFAEQCGMPIEYRAIEASNESLARELAALASRGGRGCNITAPLKHAAWRLATRDSDDARRARAANTLVFEPGGTRFADNTDGRGLAGDLARVADFPLVNSVICLLGAGGAAAGALAALLRAGPDRVVIANRTIDRAEKLADRHVDLGPVSACDLDATARMAPFDVVINATSMGHDGGAPELPATWLSPRGLCYDLNYGRAAEPLRRACAKAGIRYSDGLGMLVGQAALSFHLWTGVQVDPAPVLDVLRNSA